MKEIIKELATILDRVNQLFHKIANQSKIPEEDLIDCLPLLFLENRGLEEQLTMEINELREKLGMEPRASRWVTKKTNLKIVKGGDE